MEDQEGFWPVLYRQFASLKLTVFVLFALAASSLIGTLLPQGLTDHELMMRYSPSFARMIDFFGLNDLYHAGWFRILILLLCLNLIVCTFERLPKTLKMLRLRDDRVDPRKLVKFGHHARFTTALPREQAQPILERTIAAEFATPVPLQQSDTAYGATAEKGRWSLIMVYVVHLSVLIVLLGALLGSIFGFKGFMNIPEGESLDKVHLQTGNAMIPLPFQVRCDKFEASFYDTGMPKDYRSDLTVVENGREVLKQSIRVNDPLTYKGITFYQASYGSTLKKADLELQDTVSGNTRKVSPAMEEPVTIPETKDQLLIMQYQENFSGLGPALAIALLREGEDPKMARILSKHPEFHGNRLGNYVVRVLDVEQSRYTGLQVKMDPGVWVVWFGFTALVAGIAATYYTSHRKLWVWASREGSVTNVVVAGRADKNSFAFERRFEELCERLQSGLQAERSKDGPKETGAKDGRGKAVGKKADEKRG